MQSSPKPRIYPTVLPGSAPVRPAGETPETVLTLSEVQRFLAGKDENARLAALAEGDPLDLAERSKRWLTRSCLLFDVQPFVERASVAISRDHALFGQLAGVHSLPLECWLDRGFRRTANTLHARDQELDAARRPLPDPLSPRFLFLQAVLGIERTALRSACITANALPEDERRAFHFLLVQGRSLDEYAHLGGVGRAGVKRAFQSAMKTIGGAHECAARGEDFPMEQA